MKSTKIIVSIILTLVLTNLISWKHSSDLFAKSSEINPEFVQEGVASWYGPGFQGRKTANGERFNTYEMTAAHKTLPFNTLVKVTNLSNGLSTVVRINDRGPFIRGRIIDLSNAAKQEIEMGGLAQVRIEIHDPEEDIEEEDNIAPANLFEEEIPMASKIYAEWIKDTTSEGKITKEDINQIFNSSRIRIKILTPDVTDAELKIYQGTTSGFDYFDITHMVKSIQGYSIEVAKFSDKSLASDLIKKLESRNLSNIFLEERIYESSYSYKILVGNYKTLEETSDDLQQLRNIDRKLKTRIVKIGS